MADILWTKAELADWAADLGGEWRGEPHNVSGISIDSRSLAKGEAFFAIKGEHFDGHDYAAAAAQAGAALLVIDRAHAALAAKISAPCLIVADVLGALERLGAAARARLAPQARVAAITGSVGKTTIKEMLAQILAQFGKVHKNPASFNNHWGVPLTLARMPRDTDYAIFEMGMNHPQEIAPLAQLARPHLALISKIAAVHMAHFGSLREIAAAKAEIFSGLEPEGLALISRDDSQYQFLRRQAVQAGARVYSFGASEGADYRLTEYQETEQGSEFAIRFWNKAEAMTLPAHGEHMALNGCAAAAAACELIIPDSPNDGNNFAFKFLKYIKPIAAALGQFRPIEGRGASYDLPLPAAQGGGSFTLIDESYNANPASMRAALANLGLGAPARRIAVLGDMLELDDTAKAEHAALAEPLAAAKVNIAFLVGPLMLALAEKLERGNIQFYWQEDIAGLAEKLAHMLQKGDCLMVKSSHSIQTHALVKALREYYH